MNERDAQAYADSLNARPTTEIAAHDKLLALASSHGHAMDVRATSVGHTFTCTHDRCSAHAFTFDNMVSGMGIQSNCPYESV